MVVDRGGIGEKKGGNERGERGREME